MTYYRSVSTDPARLEVVHYPAEVLRRKAAPADLPAAELAVIADRMIHLMRREEGIGLAAPQVGLPIRLFVVDVPPGDGRTAQGPSPSATEGPIVLVNPAAAALEGIPQLHEEGCLSLPDIRGDVMRPPKVTFRAHDLSGREFTIEASGLLARCLQHELDHLDGILILDRMTQMSRLRNRAAVRDLERSAVPRGRHPPR
ncbi:MAG: peptide deformylase [Phycisphaerae bacterium]|nr:peptide deformylase [Phycisphaerae bacterium]